MPTIIYMPLVTSIHLAGDYDLDQLFGKDNVDRWADLNNNRSASEIAARRSWALSEASKQLRESLRGGPYDTDELITGLEFRCAQLAGVLLYESRGITDFNPETGQAVHKLIWHRKQVDRFTGGVHAGVTRIAGNAMSVSTYPSIEIEE